MNDALLDKFLAVQTELRAAWAAAVTKANEEMNAAHEAHSAALEKADGTLRHETLKAQADHDKAVQQRHERVVDAFHGVEPEKKLPAVEVPVFVLSGGGTSVYLSELDAEIGKRDGT